MKSAIFGTAITFVLLTLWLSFYTIESGHVGIKKTLGKVDTEEVSHGINFKLPWVTTVEEAMTKEIDIDLSDLTPKAKDNLSLQDFDITVFYQAESSQAAELKVKYGAAPSYRDGKLMPGHKVVRKNARGVSYDVIAEYDSLQIHKQRKAVETAILTRLQDRLERDDPGIFVITRVIVRSAMTDASIEQSIKNAVKQEKILEAKTKQVEIAEKEAEIEIARAHGVAEANRIINDSLTAAYLQHELNLALQTFAEKGNGVVVVPANTSNLDLILPSETLQASKR